MNKKFAIILSGSGVYDGSEINEVVLTLLALEHNKIEYQCFAPNIEQHHVINHKTGEPTSDKRNVLEESARIVRGKVKDLAKCDPNYFDALIIPGGFGVAKNLSDFAFKSEKLAIEPSLMKVLKQFKQEKKPVGCICIAPVLLPLIYGAGVILTIGNDVDTIAVINKIGGIHHIANVDEIIVDEHNKVVTTPAYMLAKNISEAKLGIDKLVAKVNELSN